MLNSNHLFFCGIFVFLTLNVCHSFAETTIDCPFDRFRCDHGTKCINMNLVCDENEDCKDATDEKNCDFIKCRPPKWYQCNDDKCIDHNLRCDGHNDCPKNDDEYNCTNYQPHHEKLECTDKEFTCQEDSLCLPLEMVCDGTKHCMDGSDESIGCLDVRKNCKGFVCRNKHCLTDRNWVCDGYNDCGDNSDEEEHCVNNCLLENRKFLCTNNDTCIPIEKVCDDHKDCSDGSDESSECTTMKSSNICGTFGCPTESNCTLMPTHATCLCPFGYRYNSQTRKCEDINECLTYGICSHGCINSKGSYKCVCAPEFKLLDDNRTCEVIADDDPLLLYAGDKAVYALTLKTKHMYPVVNNVHQVIGISYDGEFVYWTEISLHMESIMRSKADGSQAEVLLTSGLAAPEDIAVDYFTGNIYLTDNGFMHIAVCSKDGRYCTTLVTDNVHKPRGIVLHPQKGTMYWSDWGSNPMIAVASMDGKLSRPFITDDIHWPNGLALDWPNERLYWVDAKLKSIDSVDFEGRNRRSVIKNVSKHPYGIAIFQDTLYWSDWNSKSIQSCDKFTGKHRTTIVKDSKIYDVHIYHPATQGVGVNKCRQNVCSHLCLLAMNNTYSCECPKNMELDSDQHTCKPTHKQKTLLLGIGNRFIRFNHQPFGRHNDAKGETINFNIHKITYNSITNDAIAVDNTEKIIYKFNLDSNLVKPLISQNLGIITALTFDHLANNLYWSDSERGTVEVFSFNTQKRAVVHHFIGTEIPVALTIIPEVGKMFIALRSSTHTHIDMFMPDGRGRHYHVLEEDIGSGRIHMVPDFELHEVFWADYEKRRIAYTDYDGTMHHIFLGGISKPASMAILGDDIFWTTSKSTKLNWTPKHNLAGTKSLTIEQPIFSLLPDTIELVTITPMTVSKHTCMQIDNGGCSHICIALSEQSHSCLCPIGMVFKDSKNSQCVDTEDCEFRCDSGECVPNEKRCDGFKDCVDNSDEENCGSQNVTQVVCDPDEFTCADGTKCVARMLRCNQNYDCDDKSDELDCKNYDRNTHCHKLQHVCFDGKCIDASAVCDGFNDCRDGSDEKNCKSSEKICPSDMFRCSSGQCIIEKWVCDGDGDCSDSSDEFNCTTNVKCPENSRQCDHGGCIDKQLWCDGNNDCADFSDEFDCNVHIDLEITCGSGDNSEEFYQCPSDLRMCLNKTARCNGTTECPRGEDEVNCPGCSHNQFKCANSLCIRMEWLCDGQNDCSDGSDELNCLNTTSASGAGIFHRKCHPENEFDCKDGTCINWDRVCDKQNDCANGNDEDGACKTACTSGHPCKQTCTKSPSGPICGCHDGYELNGDKKTCSDINECTNGDFPCAQLCENTRGSYRCSCYSEFMLRPDKSSCKSIYAQKYFLYSSYGTILRLQPNLDVIWSANSSSSQIKGMDLNYEQQLLYFTVEDQSTLYELNLTSKRLTQVDNVGTPTKITVDWVTNNVYFIDYNTEGSSIRVCHMRERRCIKLLTFSRNVHVKSIVVDPLNHHLFYSSIDYFSFTSTETRIFMANLDGTQAKITVNGGYFITSFTIDPYSERVYFTDLEKRSLFSIRYDGTKTRNIIDNSPMLLRPNIINFLEGHMVIMNIGSKTVVDCALYGDRQCKSIKVNVASVDNLIVAQKSRQPEASDNVCANNNCTTICMPSDAGAKCLCSFGISIEPNESCSNESNEVGAAPSFQNSPETNDSEVKGSFNGIVGTISVLLGIVVIVMGGFFIYKRKLADRDINVSMHFQNPKTAFDAAKLRICQMPEMVRGSSRLNEIFVNGRHDTSKVPATLEEADETELYQDDHRRHLLS